MRVCPCTDRKLSLTEGHLPANLGALSASGDQKLMLSYSPLRREQLKHLKCVVFLLMIETLQVLLQVFSRNRLQGIEGKKLKQASNQHADLSLPKQPRM